MSFSGVKYRIITNATAVLARFNERAPRFKATILKTTAALGVRLHSIVVDDKLAGGVLHRRTGRLASAQTLEVNDLATGASATVGFNKGTVPYGVYQEFGVPHPWVIEATRAKALRFTIGGQVMFRKRVVHPGLPERSFLRSALEQLRPEVGPAYETALKEASAL